MRKVFTIFLFIFLSSSLYSQVIRFNKSLYPLNTDLSDIYNIISIDSIYLCYGVGIIQNLYPQSLFAFNLDINGNVQSSKLYGDTNIVGYCIEESIIKNNYNPYLISLSKNYNYNPFKWETILYKFNNIDTITTIPVYIDTMTSVFIDNVILDNYIYSTGDKAYGVDDADHYDVIFTKTDTLGNLAWIKNFGGSSMDIGYKIIKTFDNNLIIAARRCAYPTTIPNYHDCQTWILKLDTAGNIIWQKDFGNTDLQDLPPFGLIETHDSCYIITGGYAIENSGGASIIPIYKGWILKIDRNGNKVWSKLYGKSSQYNYTSIIKEKTNNDLITVYNLGWHNGYHTAYDPIIQCLSPTGEIKWFRPYYFNGDEYADKSVLNTFDFTPDGGYIFAGYGTDYDSVPATRSWIIKTDSLGFDGTYYHGDTTLNVSIANDTVCFSDSVLVEFRITGKSAPYSISLNNGNAKDSLYYSPLYEPYVYDSLYIYPTDSFTYHNFTATISDAWGNTKTVPLSVYISSCYLGIKEQKNNNYIIKIHPNPAKTSISLMFTDKADVTEKNIFIYDVFGRKVLEQSVIARKNNVAISIDVSSLPKGVYFVRVGGAVGKFIKN